VTQASASFAYNEMGSFNVTVSVNDNLCGSYVTSLPFQVIVDPLPPEYGWLTGTVRDATDPLHPAIQGATVAAVMVGTTEAFSISTDTSGHYNLTLAVGTYVVGAGQALYTPEIQTGVNVTLMNETVLNFDLTQLRGYLVGTVSSSAGGTLENATIYVTGPRSTSTRTDAQGHYNVTLPPGLYNATATRTGYLDQTKKNLTVLPNVPTTADFTLDPIAVPVTGLSPLAIAGIAAVVVVVIAGVAYVLFRRRKKTEEIEAPPEPPAGPKGPA